MEFIIEKLDLKIDSKTLKNLVIEDEENFKLFIDRTKDLDYIIFLNCTSKQYIIGSATSTINSNSPDYFIVNMILTPNILVSFCKKGSIKKYLNIQRNYAVKFIYDEKHVFDANVHALNVGFRNTPHFVVGRKAELSETLDFYMQLDFDNNE